MDEGRGRNVVVGGKRVSDFVSDKIGRGLCPPFTALGIERDGEIIAGAIFNVFEAEDVHVTISGTGWTKGFLAEVGHYVFTVLKKSRITALTEQEKVVSFGLRLGGRVEGVMRDHFGPGRDATIIGILKNEYRF